MGVFMDVNISIGYNANNSLYDNVKLSFNLGEITHLIGENGAGKSTLYKTLIGELQPISGCVSDDIKKNIAVISDYVSLPKELKIIDIIKLIGEKDINYMRENFAAITKIILEIRQQKISQLSTGQKRIVEIFTALSAKKSILILDEACNGLDYKNRDFFIKNITELLAQNKVSILHTSHNLEDVIELGGNVYILDKYRKEFYKYNGTMSMDELSLFLKKH